NTNDALQLYAIDIFGAQNICIEDVWGRIPNLTASAATWSLVRQEPSDPTNDNTAAFWNTILRCGTRQDTGNVTYYAPFGVQLLGADNATVIKDCNFVSVVDCIGITAQQGGGATGTLSNATLITGNSFEGATNAVHVDSI